MKKLLLTATLVLGITTLAGCESLERASKNIDSEFGGLERVVRVVGIDGNEIQRYEGKFDVKATESKVKFIDDKGKSHIIYRSQTDIIFVDEK